jgi:IgGFc binding protein
MALLVGLVAVPITLLVSPTPDALAAPTTIPSSQGTDFWVAFESNCTINCDGIPDGTLFLFVSGDTATTGTVTDAAISFSQTFSVTPGTTTEISVPGDAEDNSNDSTIVGGGLHVTAGAPVSVYGLNTEEYSTDGYLGLPTPILGTSYIAEGYENDAGFGGSDFAVVATQNDTTVTITPSEDSGAHAAGVPYTENLNQGDMYQLIDESGNASGGDLSGSTITSNNPVAVFAGDDCARVPPTDIACNTLAEEMTPTDTWGTDFLTEPLASRSGDTFRIMASENGTTVDIDGSQVATLNADQFYETILSSASTITANNPVQLMQYSNSSSYDGANSDPFDITIPPTEQFLNSYTVATEPDGADPAITQNYLNIVAPTSEVTTIDLDGTDLPSSDFTAIAGSSYSGAQVAVDFGSHTISAPLPFGLTVYGEGGYDGYGYPGGFTLSPIATVASVSLAPTTSTNSVGTSECETATVSDTDGNPVAGVLVNFTVTGTNPSTGFAYSASDGTAQYCYSGASAGTDSETAAVGSITSNTATITWMLPSTSLTTSLSGGGASGSTISVPAGTAVTDSAALSGTNASVATGSVTYNVYSGPSCSTVVSSGTPETITVPGTLPSSAPLTLSTPGTYYWQASYSGDNKNAGSTSTCGSEVETVTSVATTAPSKDGLAAAFNAHGKVTAKISTTVANDLLVAFVAGCGPSSIHQTAQVSGGGLTWTLVGRTDTEHGTSEIWSARASGVVSDLPVTATLATLGYPVGLTVVGFSNATGTGNVTSAWASTGAPKGTVKTSSSPSWVWAVGNDPLAATGRKVPSGQTLEAQKLDYTTEDTFWVQSLNDETLPTGSSATINDTAPKYDPWNLTLVEIL